MDGKKGNDEGLGFLGAMRCHFAPNRHAIGKWVPEKTRAFHGKAFTLSDSQEGLAYHPAPRYYSVGIFVCQIFIVNKKLIDCQQANFVVCQKGGKMARAKKKERTVTGQWAPKSDETLGQYLRRLRTEKARMILNEVDLSTRGFPPQMRVSSPYLSQLECGKVEYPSGDRLRVLADIYGVPQRWILEKAGFRYVEDDATLMTRLAPDQEDYRIALQVAQLMPKAKKALLRIVAELKKLDQSRRTESDEESKS